MHLFIESVRFLKILLVTILFHGKTQCIDTVNDRERCSLNPLEQQLLCKNVNNFFKFNINEFENQWNSLKIINDRNHILSIKGSQQLNTIQNLDLSEVIEVHLADSGFKLMPNLKFLNISKCQVNELNSSHFGAYNHLEYLDASWNFLKELTFNFKSRVLYLQVANFSHNNIRMVERDSWKVFQKLNRLHLGNNEIKTLRVHNYPQLKYIDLSDNELEQITHDTFNFLDAMEELWISSNNIYHIDNRSFESMPNLKLLNLSSNNLDQLSCEVFWGLNRLQQLDLQSNNLKFLEQFQFQHLRKLQYLDLSSNNLKSLNSTHFRGLSDLRKLLLSNNDIHSISSNTFDKLIAMSYLDISSNNIQYFDIDIFGHATLSRMRTLLLSNNNVQQLHPLALSSLPFLENLFLDNNNVDNLDIRTFAPMRYLAILDLGNNSLENIPQEILLSFESNIVELHINNNRLSFLPSTNATFAKLHKISIEGNPWQCPCLDDMLEWFAQKNIQHISQESPYFKGEKPLCVVTTVNYCNMDLMSVREHYIENIYNNENDY